MTTAIAEATAPELALHTFNAAGVCENAEVVTVSSMPKGHALEIHVASAPDGLWRVGYRWAIDKTKESETVAVFLDSPASATRIEAIWAGLKQTAKHFDKSKKATDAIEAFYDAGKAAAGQAPEVPAAPKSNPLPKGRFADLPVLSIAENPENHRKHHDGMKAKEMVDSIVELGGLLHPIAVRLMSADELGEMPMGGVGVGAQRYEIILGHRRWRAHVALGLETIEAKVYEGVTRRQGKAAALIENLQREDVNPIEEAEGYRDLMEAESITQDECARRVGRSRSVIANAIRVLAVPAVVELISEGKLTMAHGLALHKYATRPEIVRVIAEQCVLHATSAGQLEEWNKANYVPFFRELAKAGIVEVIHRSDLPGGWSSEWPEAWATDSDYQPVDSYSWICWVPAKGREFMAAWKAEAAEEKKKAEAKLAAARKKSGIKSLDDLDSDNYEVVGDHQAEIAELLPESKILTLKKSCDSAKDETVTVCTAPKFTEAVSDAMIAAKVSDRAAKLPALLAEARAKVKKWKKLGPAETSVVLALVLMTDDDTPAMLSPVAGKSQGVTIPAVLKLEEYDGWQRAPEDMSKAIKALAADPVGYARVLVDHFLLEQFAVTRQWDRVDEPSEWGFGNLSGDGRVLLSAILEKPLGFLEDTAAGRRKLAAQVKALPWYAAAFEQASKAGGDMTEIDEAEAAAGAEGGEDDDDEK